MIKRSILKELKLLLKEYPVVTVLGPRQAGKTTLVKDLLKGFGYSNLEVPEIRELAINDPRAYLKTLREKTIIDEIQRVPMLLSYIQEIVDSKKKNGQFILTGSHQLQLHESISQSLAGRTAILTLLPLSIEELKNTKWKFSTFEEYCFHGFMPRVYDQNQRPRIAYSNYFQTYVERDVRQLINLKDVSSFEKLIKLLAGRVGQIIDYGSLGNDVGVDGKTIKHWLSILEASFIIYKLTPYYKNFGKRIIKSPKYYFCDVGLLCYLLGHTKYSQVGRDPLVGSIFENLIVIEILKQQLNLGHRPNLYFYRDNNGFEIDLILEQERNLTTIEIKSAQTYNASLIINLKKFRELSKNVVKSYLIYNGKNLKLSDNTFLLHFSNVEQVQ